MLGTALSGTEGCPGEIIEIDGKKYMEFRGMGSQEVMDEGGASRYGQPDTSTSKRKPIPQGVKGLVPYQGPLGPVIDEWVGGLCIGMGLTGSRVLADLRTCEFIEISPAALQKSLVHGVTLLEAI
jgi:IMP dehydrogenase